MKLKEFNTSNSKTATPGEPTIRLNSKAGLFGISKAAAELLSLNDTSKIVIVQDEENPTDWYIKVSTDQNAFTIRKGKNASDYSFNCTPVTKSILDSIKPALKPVFVAAGFKLSKTPVEIEDSTYWTIITANPINPR